MGHYTVGRLQRTGERGRGNCAFWSEPGASQRHLIDSVGSPLKVVLTKASAVMEERASGSQPYRSFEKERSMSSLVLCYSAWALLGVAEHCPEEGLPGDRRGKSRLQIHVLLGLLADQKSTFSMCVLSAEWLCPLAWLACRSKTLAGLCLFSAYRSNEKLLAFRLQLEGGEQLRNCLARRVFFVHHSNL